MQKRVLLIFILTIMVFSITSCKNSKENTKEVTTATESQENMKTDVYNYVVDLWNDGFCNVYHYVEDVKNATGKEMDINTTISHIDRIYSKQNEYDKLAQNIEDKEFIDLWNSEKVEIDKLYNRIKEETPRPSDSTYCFDYSEFQDIMYELMDVMVNLFCNTTT